LQATIKLCRTTFAQSRREFVSMDIESDCGCVATGHACKNPHLRHLVGE
jgi:hypothetical protein